MGSRTSDDAFGRRQRQVLRVEVVEVATERGHCRYILTL
jgi:hypothetical protein